jgi:hypothetical protein
MPYLDWFHPPRTVAKPVTPRRVEAHGEGRPYGTDGARKTMVIVVGGEYVPALPPTQMRSLRWPM